MHGGRLTNALFANNLQVLVEMFNSETRSHLPFISKQLGAKHFYLKANSVETLNKQVIGLEDDKNMTISLQSAKKFFRLLFFGKFDSLGTSRPLLIDLTWKYSSKIVFSVPICMGKALGVLPFRYENSF